MCNTFQVLLETCFFFFHTAIRLFPHVLCADLICFEIVVYALWYMSILECMYDIPGGADFEYNLKRMGIGYIVLNACLYDKHTRHASGWHVLQCPCFTRPNYYISFTRFGLYRSTHRSVFYIQGLHTQTTFNMDAPLV